MKRSQFIALLSTLPFLGKLKKEKVKMTDYKSIADHYSVPKAKLQDYESVTFNTDFVIKGEDLVCVIKKKA